MAGVGKVIRKHNVDWIVSFNKNIGLASNNIAEAWAIREGLKLALLNACYFLIIETYSQLLIDLLRNPSIPCHSLSPLLSDCETLMRQLQEVELRHIFEEANHVANVLAKEGAKQ
ncbi:hypothetical protein ACH5RR_012805 [Cinchona calisaya]|uniref:RNase H type-1 domain-containing protein n=1 Tax=Cinchona calisaya TaxID=153742 RepID=A0ABD3A8T3_9GENT